MKSRTHFAITGHIDHGKSTFVGRLLLELGAIPADKIENLKVQSTGARLEYAHLTDALSEEKKRGITIGVSQIFFSYKNRDFVFIDAPGHFEFIQNMITGASRSDLAFLIVDINEGVQESTLRHLQMLSFLDISEVAVIINKMDLVQYSESAFLKLKADLIPHFVKLNLIAADFIPASAYLGENLTQRSAKMPWYKGALVTDVLVRSHQKTPLNRSQDEFRFIVQDVFKNHVLGELVSGELELNTPYQIHQLPEVKFALSAVPEGYQGARIRSFELGDTTKIRRGQIVTAPDSTLQHLSEMDASVLWFSEKPVAMGQSLRLRLGKSEVSAVISEISSVLESSSLSEIKLANTVKKANVVKCRIRTEHAISFDFFRNDVATGRFVLLQDGVISGAGKII